MVYYFGDNVQGFFWPTLRFLMANSPTKRLCYIIKTTTKVTLFSVQEGEYPIFIGQSVYIT
jgi:hypothetical protein